MAGPKLIPLKHGFQMHAVFIAFVGLGYGEDGNMFNDCVCSKFIISFVQVDPFQDSEKFSLITFRIFLC